MKLLISTHNDDSVLFASFALQAARPRVLTVFDSYIQVARGQPRCDAATRRDEDIEAITRRLKCTVQFAGVRDDLQEAAARVAVREALSGFVGASMNLYLSATTVEPIEEVWLPAVEENGHDQHNMVGEIGLEVFAGAKIHRYLSYTRTGGKSTNGNRVPCNGLMVRKKLEALACYKTQIEIEALGCWPHFLDLNEYLVD